MHSDSVTAGPRETHVHIGKATPWVPHVGAYSCNSEKYRRDRK